MKIQSHRVNDGYRVKYLLELKNVLQGTGKIQPPKSMHVFMTLIELLETKYLINGQLLEYKYTALSPARCSVSILVQARASCLPRKIVYTKTMLDAFTLVFNQEMKKQRAKEERRAKNIGKK